MLQTKKHTPGAVDRSYQLLALLDVCEHSARYIGGGIGSGYIPRAAGSLANVLELASEIASELHDALELAEQSQAVAS